MRITHARSGKFSEVKNRGELYYISEMKQCTKRADSTIGQKYFPSIYNRSARHLATWPQNGHKLLFLYLTSPSFVLWALALSTTKQFVTYGE